MSNLLLRISYGGIFWLYIEGKSPDFIADMESIRENGEYGFHEFVKRQEGEIVEGKAFIPGRTLDPGDEGIVETESDLFAVVGSLCLHGFIGLGQR